MPTASPGAVGGFAHGAPAAALTVEFPDRWLTLIPPEKQPALLAVLANDPRPAYQENPERVYGFGYGGFDIRFRVNEQTLTVVEVVEI